jgi:hypothetical protein
MKFIDRACFNGQYFHGNLAAVERRVRAWALLWNFCPSSPQTVKKYYGQRCPAERLNGKRYAQNWLENLLVSGSMNGYQRYQQNPLYVLLTRFGVFELNSLIFLGIKMALAL